MSVHPRTTALIASAALSTTALLGVAGHAEAAGGRTTLPGSVPSWAYASQRVGAPAGGQQVTFRMYLDWSHAAAARQYALDVATPGSPVYRHFLSPAKFTARFAPSQHQVDAVRGWLSAHHLAVGAVPANRKYVEATGTLAAAGRAFNTSFANYRVQGRTLRSNTGPLSVPTALTGVESVVGLDQSSALVRHFASPPAAFVNGRPCSAYWGEKTVAGTPTPDGTKLPASPQAYAPCGYAGAQLQGAYGMNGAIASGNDGHGVTVGIIDAFASTTVLQDANTYSARHGLPSLNGHFSQHVAPGTYNHPVNNRQDPQGWSGEETLDVEAVHTMAPGADILYVGAPNNEQSMDAAMNWIVSRRAADIVSNSYGWSGEAVPNGFVKAFNDILMQAATEGISNFFSSGDNGDETNGVAGARPTPDWPASSPYVTAVGGTSMGIGASNQRQFELGWETEKSVLKTGAATPTWADPTWLYGGGGGTSRLFAQPGYQKGVVTAISTTARVVPDVSALGDPNTGMLVGQTQTFPDGSVKYSEYRIGGTSLSSPLYAGMFALAVQKAGHDYGLANPVLYATRAASSDITQAQLAQYPGDVRVDYRNGVDASNGYRYSARYFDRDAKLTIHVRDGYDDVTGIGSPNGQPWLDAIVTAGK